MSIIFNSEKKIFSIKTADFSYIMQISDSGYLLHKYFGKAIGDDDLSFATLEVAHASFSPNPADESFSLDSMPQEYSASQTGDFRVSSVDIKSANGEYASEVKYVSHEIITGKPQLKDMPSIFAENDEATTLVLTCEDVYAKAEIKLYYSIIEKLNIIVRSVKIKNIGDGTFHLMKMASSCVDFCACDFDMTQLYGTWSKECNVERINIPQGIHSIASRRGSSSHQHNPFVAISDKDATETSGNVYGFNLLYSGNFAIELERDYLDNLRVVCGINSWNFDFELSSGEEFQTPEVVFTYSPNGFGELSRTYHKLYKNHISKSKWAHKKRPLLINTWEAAYFNFTDETIIEYAKHAKELGIELLVMDDGWFGKRNNDKTSLGDWFVNTEKLKKGLPKMVEEINEIGMDFGIWYEPEMISPVSELYKKHPEWCMHMSARPNCLGRNQYVLNLALKEVQDYLFDVMTEVLKSCNITYVKWDFNRNLTNVSMEDLPNSEKGETFHRYVLGLYSLLERLTDELPEILFEGCSGGGGRFDPALLRYFPQNWASDDTDAVERIQIQYGTSMAYPVSAIGSHVSNCPNHQTGRTSPLKMRSAIAMMGTYGFELSPLKLTDEEKDFVKEEIKLYHKYYDLINNGELYRLTNPFENPYYCATEFVSPSKDKALVTYVVSRSRRLKPVFVKLQGLNEHSKYKDMDTGICYFGDTLMNLGLNFSKYTDEGESVRVYLEEI